MKWMVMKRFLVYAGLLALVACKSGRNKQFERLESQATGIDFINSNTDTDSLNILDYLYYYNGAGVAAGDINNDGLTDLYFVSNQEENHLYLNKGNFKFEDITRSAGVAGSADWSTGVVMADVNGDGFLDIYVSTVTDHRPEGSATTFFKRGSNQLFINNRDGTFTERASQYGLDLKGYNTQAVFFDYDRDGDLDLFQLQHSIHRTDTYGDTSVRRQYSDISGGKLFRNDSMHFTNVTSGSGIYSSVLGYGLGVVVTDFNNDGWEDIYVGNDFHENDYYYVNDGNGRFEEMSASAFGHMSNFSMGNDAADLNNDGWPDIVTLDMLPADEKVLKSTAADESFDTYSRQRSLGYGYQYARNCLQLNTGHGSRFSEQALLSGIAATDWSWAPLFADFNLDGQQDLFISNGIKRRLNDMDYIKFMSNGASLADKELLSRQPDGAWHNYMFEGSDSLKFYDRSTDWGFDEKTLSNGTVYADLDNDGDLDLVTNDLNQQAGIYRNLTITTERRTNYLTIRLIGAGKNVFGIGAKAAVFSGAVTQYAELQTVRGFMSSVEPLLHFGFKPGSSIDSIRIWWPDNTITTVYQPKQNQLLTIRNSDSKTVDNFHWLPEIPSGFSFQDITSSSGIQFMHKENLGFVDFNRQLLIPHEVSTAGPAVAIGDVNNDGLDDIFFGGAKYQKSELYLQTAGGHFTRSLQEVLEADSLSEDVDAVFFDANKDGYQDLYVVSGGNEYFGNMTPLLDRLYINDRKGSFFKAQLPALYENKSVVRVADYDGDGDPDLFVGGRVNSQAYGRIPRSALLQNDGAGRFTDVTKLVCPELENAGMITDAIWIPRDNGALPQLLLVGEWMAPTIFENDGRRLKRKNDAWLGPLTGWWSSAKLADMNGDGHADIFLGNYGLNSKLHASSEFPLRMILSDVDNNQTVDQLMALESAGQYFPFQSKEVLDKQLPFLKKEFLSYSKMAGVPFSQVFRELPDTVLQLSAAEFRSIVLIGKADGSFVESKLPDAAQVAPIFAFFNADFNHDGHQDLIAGGNFYGVTPYEGRYDGLLLTPFPGSAGGTFEKQVYEPVTNSIRGEIRKMVSINVNGQACLLIVRNNDRPVLLSY